MYMATSWNVSSDAWVDIFSFSTPRDLLSVALTCSQMAQFIFDTKQESCSRLWYNQCVSQAKYRHDYEPISNKLFDDTQHIHSFKDLYRARDFVFDKAILNPKTSLVEFTNGNRTAFNLRGSEIDNKWEILRVNYPMKPGGVYQYEFVVDRLFQTGGNVWMITVGLTSEDTVFQKADIDSFPPWIGHSGTAAGLILFDGNWMHNTSFSKSPLMTQTFAQKPSPFVKDGDVVGFLVNRQHPMKILIDVMVNGEKIFTSPFSEFANDEKIYYPAASMINQQRISVYNGLHKSKALAPSLSFPDLL